MSTSSTHSPASNTWRWLGAGLLVLLLLGLWYFGMGPGVGCCGGGAATPVAGAAGAAQGEASFAWDGKTVTLTGEVGSDADRQKLVAAAAASYGAANVVDQLKITAGLGRLGNVALTGVAADEAEKTARSTTLANALPMVPVENRLTLATPVVVAAAPGPVAPTPVAPAPVAPATEPPPPLPAAPPVTAPAVAASADCSKLMTLQVSFATGSARINPQSQALLRQAAKCITGPMRVGGHTDDRGSSTINARLSQARAQAVLNLLVQYGAKRSLLTAQGFGPDKPVADNTTDEGRAKNRRIELTTP
jgi:peptidoglycan-binding protein ArfA